MRPQNPPDWLRIERRWFWELDEDDLLARVVLGEAEGECIEGKVGVACVVRNRVLLPWWWGRDYRTVILATSQFSAFNGGSRRLSVMRAPRRASQAWKESRHAAAIVYDGSQPDITGGADHYFSDSIAPPSWAATMVKTARIGRHTFYQAFGA